MNKPFTVFVKVTGIVPYLVLMRPKIYYEDKSVQSRKIQGKAIVMPDHHEIWDVATMMHAFPFRNLRCIISELICSNKAISLFVKGMGFIITDRANMDFSFLTKAEKVLKENGVIELYPEGRLPKEDEETPLPFKPSIAYLALNTGAPIIPVVSNGSFAKKERMRVLIGTPIDVRELYDDALNERENIENITNILRNKIKELKNELERQTKNRTKHHGSKVEKAGGQRITV